jgi:Zn-dependent peptidase ImmA (M78 family)
MNNVNDPRHPSVVAQLRALMPARSLTLPESLRIAELQATRLLALLDVKTPPVPESVVLDLRHISVERYDPLPMSGYTHWSKGRWQIVLNGAESAVRQRFSLVHELKHVLDHPFIGVAYTRMNDPEGWAEQVCHYFAGCVLMPRAWVKSQFFNQGVQDVATLAGHFDVSRAAMRVRLAQLGMGDALPRCGYFEPTRPTARKVAA